MKNVKLLIFDLDNTLINYGGVTQKAWELTCKSLIDTYLLGYDHCILANEIVKVNNSIWSDENSRPKGAFSFDELRKSIVEEALKNLGIYNQEFVEFLVQHYSHFKHEAVYMFEDVPKTLTTLKDRGYMIALLTNGDGEIQREKLNRFHMMNLFDDIFISGEQGVEKPSNEAYENVMKHYDIQSHEACMIGDHFLWEVVAPKNIGLMAIWVNRGDLGVEGNESVEADYEIKSIKERDCIMNCVNGNNSHIKEKGD